MTTAAITGLATPARQARTAAAQLMAQLVRTQARSAR
jgi:hypothetical protein